MLNFQSPLPEGRTLLIKAMYRYPHLTTRTACSLTRRCSIRNNNKSGCSQLTAIFIYMYNSFRWMFNFQVLGDRRRLPITISRRTWRSLELQASMSSTAGPLVVLPAVWSCICGSLLFVSIIRFGGCSISRSWESGGDCPSLSDITISLTTWRSLELQASMSSTAGPLMVLPAVWSCIQWGPQGEPEAKNGTF